MTLRINCYETSAPRFRTCSDLRVEVSAQSLKPANGVVVVVGVGREVGVRKEGEVQGCLEPLKIPRIRLMWPDGRWLIALAHLRK